ncbi:small acid-soluble spore protein Tlp [Aquibacillus halophilus]|uniref:Small, acid-soluble spore protein Tlp n=1 Tax=Aquibacillus halophilus TaxID=930132 RepID=A0A6A8DA14_9BACI|nr:small acid-soluble spore protein Tlp [Aquibacillus halophilus]MRH42603.1 small acid-soluble spore protein Tlp [Aquibacillus halophilus]
MSHHNTKPNPDNREDNVEKLQHMVQDTIQNIEASHETMKFASGQEKERIKEKNARREESIRDLRNEIKDEYQYQQKQ